MQRINEDIKNGNFKQIYLLYGTEAYLKKQYKDKLKNAMAAPDDDMNFTTFEGKNINPKEVIDLAETLPFFADRRVILIEDSGFFKKLLCRIIKPFFSHQRKKAADKYPDMDKAVSDMMKMQYDAEHSEKPSVDMSAHPTALMLAAVLSAEAHDEIQKRVLYEFGYHIGRWIYLVDAADDIEKDIKSNGFNPFVNKKTGEVKSSDFIKAVLNQSLARAYDAYNLLNFTDFKGILDNMMLLGFPASQNRVTSKLDTEVNNE